MFKFGKAKHDVPHKSPHEPSPAPARRAEEAAPSNARDMLSDTARGAARGLGGGVMRAGVGFLGDKASDMARLAAIVAAFYFGGRELLKHIVGEVDGEQAGVPQGLVDAARADERNLAVMNERLNPEARSAVNRAGAELGLSFSGEAAATSSLSTDVVGRVVSHGPVKVVSFAGRDLEEGGPPSSLVLAQAETPTGRATSVSLGRGYQIGGVDAARVVHIDTPRFAIGEDGQVVAQPGLSQDVARAGQLSRVADGLESAAVRGQLMSHMDRRGVVSMTTLSGEETSRKVVVGDPNVGASIEAGEGFLAYRKDKSADPIRVDDPDIRVRFGRSEIPNHHMRDIEDFARDPNAPLLAQQNVKPSRADSLKALAPVESLASMEMGGAVLNAERGIGR